MKQSQVYFLLLTKNEASSIKEVILELRQNACDISEIDTHYAIIDDSTDETSNIAESMGVHSVPGGGRGLGYAYSVGVNWAVQKGADFIFTLDGDGQTDFSELKIFWQTLHDNKVDLVIGSRFLDSDFIKYEYPKWNRVGVYLLASYLTLVTGQKITDSHGGLRLFKAEVGQKLKLIGTHSYVQVATISAVKEGFKLIEIKSVWKKRMFGHSRVVHSRWRYIRKMSLPLILAGVPALLKRIRVKL